MLDLVCRNDLIEVLPRGCRISISEDGFVKIAEMIGANGLVTGNQGSVYSEVIAQGGVRRDQIRRVNALATTASLMRSLTTSTLLLRLPNNI
jgi:hypothetical protein